MRRSGTTTRIIDRCVQELFKNGFTFVYEGRDDRKQTKEAFDRFLKRMTSENPNDDYTVDKGVYDGIYCYKITLIQ